jgi:endoglucanase
MFSKAVGSVREARPLATFSVLRLNLAPLVLLVLVTVFPIAAISLRGDAALHSIASPHISTLYPAAQDLGLCHDFPLVTRYICGVDRYREGINYGIYDPARAFASARGFAFEHIYVSWDTYESSIPEDSSHADALGRWLLVTIEPYAHTSLEAGSQQLFRDILTGSYDANIDRICGDIQQTGRPTFVRWGHEMENLIGRYPWAQADYIGYVAAYRYVVDRCRAQAANTYYVWSPAGSPGLSDYWPGRDYADYVGLSVYELPQWDVRHHGRLRPFKEIFTEKYELVKGFGKPIMIAELGVTGDQQYQWDWMYGLFETSQQFPLLKSIVYFNSRDSELAWGPDYPVPDWRIDRRLFL